MPNPSLPHFRRALFVRLDRIGDLVLSLPIDQSLQIDAVDWWVPRGLSFIANDAVPVRNSVEFSQQISFIDVIKLALTVREKRYDFVVVFQAPWWASLVFWLARIPIRIGVKSQWHSFLFFNHAVRQKRSRAEMSELEYGYRLLEQGLDLPAQTLPRHTLKLRSKSGPSVLEKARLTTNDFYVVHPGMGGSALNWPSERYAELVQVLSKEAKVAITGTLSDEAFLTPLKALLAPPSEQVVWLDGKLSGDELIAVLESARAIVAPSTGVLHLAASTGRPTVGLFSQVLVQKALRWGPKGERVGVVEAPLGVADDVGMALISVAAVLAEIRRLQI